MSMLCTLEKVIRNSVKYTIVSTLGLGKHSILWMCLMWNHINESVGSLVQPFPVTMTTEGDFGYPLPISANKDSSKQV